ncbi:MAG: bifunctional oligoribonuclease/PAP phosphatase NrnA [Victivallaceae bacterium]
MAQTEFSIKSAADWLRQNDNFLIITHEHPDGDALGSIFGMLSMLRKNGKTADAFLPEPLPEKYLDFAPCDFRSELSRIELNSYNYCISLDNPKTTRAGMGANLAFNDIVLPVLNIDHHPDNSQFGKWNLVMPKAAATAEIIYSIFKEIPEWQISPTTASLLMLGIVTDTGGFRFDNTSPDVLRKAAELLELNADYHKIVLNMFFSNPLIQQEFEAELMMHHLRLKCNGRFAWFFIPNELLKKYSIDMRNTEGLIEALRVIKGTEIVAIMQPREEGFKISLRSKNPKYSVGAIARQLNGGGHELAAGGLIKTTSRESAEKILLAHVEKVLNEI